MQAVVLLTGTLRHRALEPVAWTRAVGKRPHEGMNPKSAHLTTMTQINMVYRWCSTDAALVKSAVPAEPLPPKTGLPPLPPSPDWKGVLTKCSMVT